LAIRSLLKSPGFLAVVVFSLALGIGANSAIFSVIDAILYRPMPYPQPERLLAIWEVPAGHPDWVQPPPIAELIDWQKQNHVFEDIALTSFTEAANMSGANEPQSIREQNVTPNFFALLGVKPFLGRNFLAEEMQDKSQTILVSDSFWKGQLHGDPHVLGRTFVISGVVSTVVGVMPPGFSPFYGGRIDMWQPINPASNRYSARQDHWLMPVGRLKPNTTMAQAQVEMDLIAARLAEAYPATNKGVGEKLVSLHSAVMGDVGTYLYPLMGAVAFVLLIGCVNVANLLQARTENRRKEYALRSALGANRSRLIQQLLTESGLLALLGGTFGIFLTYAGIAMIRALAGDFPNSDTTTVDGRVLLFTLVVSLFTAIIFGLAPAIQASRPDLNVVLREGERGAVSASRGFARNALAVTEIALAMVLLVGAGLMIDTILRLQKVNPGFDPNHVLTAQIELPEGGKYVERVPGGDMEQASPRVTAFYQELLQKLAQVPGVESVASTSSLPLRGGSGFTFSILGHPAPPPDNRPQAGYSEVSPGYFQTLRIPLRKGRYLDERDTQTTPWAIVINETLAKQYFPNEDPVGQQVLLRYDPYPVDEQRPRQIVGIVADTKHYGLGQAAPAFLYASSLQQPSVFPGGTTINHTTQTLVLRTSPDWKGREADLYAAMRKGVAEIDPDQPLTNVRTMNEVVAMSMGDARFYGNFLEIFAGIALLLALIGIYGVMSYFVSQRTHEIGVRVALGAAPADVLRLVGALGLKLAGAGVVAGALLALAVTRLIATFLYGVKPTDPLTYAIVAAGLVAVALLACLIPARRATRVDPMIALRHD
jgi:predicted permease